jgi:hypothetical protein
MDRGSDRTLGDTFCDGLAWLAGRHRKSRGRDWDILKFVTTRKMFATVGNVARPYPLPPQEL